MGDGWGGMAVPVRPLRPLEEQPGRVSDPSTASAVALARIRRDLEELRFRPLANWSAGPSHSNDPFRWLATLLGPEETPYEGGAFVLRIRFPKDYPFKPPKVKMVTKIYHPNLVAETPVCLDILTSNWSPAVSISDVMLSICSLLRAPDMDHPLNHEVALVYKENPALFRSTARRWTEEHAILK
ncbi:uncharacterized protein LOC144101731 [Amblyomma americanum]